MTWSSLRAPIAVGLGAVPGALSRYYLSHGLASITGITDFPIGTLGVNLLGCFGLGLFVTLALKNISVSPEVRLLIVTGFVGSFTTFSTYELDAAYLIDAGAWWLVAGYWVGSPLLGMLCLWGGSAVARAL